jgi:polyferredoxin
MALSPPALGGPDQGPAVLVAGSAVMIGVVVFVMEYLYRHRALQPALSTYFVGLLAAYAAMMAGLYAWQVGAGGALFAASVLAEMALFFGLVIENERLEAPAGPRWQERPGWTVGLLSAIFVAELFMGAALDLGLQPAVYGGALGGPALPTLAALGPAAWASFWFLASVTGSTWFLAMMGIEMGVLVVFKFRETRSRETRVRLALMMGCYGAFAVFFPSTYYGLLLPNAPSGTAVPVLGWSMGIGSAPVGPAVFGVLLLTYVLTGALSALFGRRVVCSAFCTAPLMYQGTTFDAMKSFNRSSPIAHKLLGSRFSRAYSLTSGTVLAALAGATTVSYFDTVGTLNWTIDGVDPTVFLFALSFSVLWYVLFVTIPYAGNYNCVTMGYCYTGAIAQAFQWLGPFSLRVKDREVCKRCTTLDCAKACPVGLVDMPGHFRTKGVFRSTKCCGVGNCAGACPYGNLYLYDIRHWVRDRWTARRGRPTGTTLPVLPSVRASGPGATPRPTTSTVRP